MNREEHLTRGELSATVYKQIPGADIEPGWWIVHHPLWWEGGRDRWFGPYRYKREAVRMAKAQLRASTPKKMSCIKWQCGRVFKTHPKGCTDMACPYLSRQEAED